MSTVTRDPSGRILEPFSTVYFNEGTGRVSQFGGHSGRDPILDEYGVIGCSTSNSSPFISFVHNDLREGRHITGYKVVPFAEAQQEHRLTHRSLIDDLQLQFERIYELAQLPENWDGMGAVPPSLEVLRKATILTVESVSTTLRPPVLIAPIPDGSLQMEWTGRNERLEVVLSSDEELFADLIRGTETDDLSIETLDPIDEATLLRIISQFTG